MKKRTASRLDRATTAGEIIGSASIAIGFGMFSLGLGLIVGGGLLVTVSFLAGLPKADS